jgi:hypothetical protein
MLYAAGLEPLGIQILSPQEIEPDVTSDLRLVDSETLPVSSVTPVESVLFDQLRRKGWIE